MTHPGLDLVDCNNPTELAGAVSERVWFHSIDLGHGIVTKGQKTQAILANFAALRLPNLAGKSVLDIDAYDGFYSFTAEQRGAKRVVALDRPVWEVETYFSDAFHRHCRETGTIPEPPYRTEWLKWEGRPGELPGKKKFDLVRRALGSRVEPVVGDLRSIGPAGHWRVRCDAIRGGVLSPRGTP